MIYRTSRRTVRHGVYRALHSAFNRSRLILILTTPTIVTAPILHVRQLSHTGAATYPLSHLESTGARI